jgi:predicted MFS family arabinose efflux permease
MGNHDLGGEIFDRTGSYELAFILSALMALVAVLCTVLIKEKRHEAVAVI